MATGKIDTLRGWQSDTSPQEKGEDIVARLYMARRDLYEAAVRHLNSEKVLSKSSYRRLEGSYMHYVIWADDYEVRVGRLDLVLAGSKKLCRFTIRPLDGICATLRNACSMHLLHLKGDSSLGELCQAASVVMEGSSYIVYNVYDDSDSGSDESDDGGIETHNESLEDSIRTLLSDVKSLIDLGLRLREPIPDHPTERRANDRNAPLRKQVETARQEAAQGGSDSVLIKGYTGLPGGVTYWYCCECGSGPMNIETTPSCVGCLRHIRCDNCRLES
ncbi:hypothetical protein F5Y04DRAFT_265022 [Hypomontagnella monticulosa]|nr:hypothetical protein F5Y04DRAFT_265022 [Hypomontagnella monticulosa]